ncbi:MAG: carbohydrate porin [Verrucomicrobiae bacterium]|nr:carbohydrate porin [Verrucomicrobiae bacterium]
MLPGRDDDALALGCIYVAASEDRRRQERDDRDFNGVPITHLSDYELVLELTYAAWITPWWYVQPDVQWVAHPGGSGANEDAWIIGLRTGLTF